MHSTPETQQNIILTKRSPIVVVMGHVDHGKTSILDYIRKSRVVNKEAGGITQHIGAYEIEKEIKENEKRKITFIDTPGHEAFSKMRGRGARAADIAVLVIAADEGFKPQTKEALAIIKEEGMPFIVAANKIDKPNANPEIIKKECGENEIYIEEWGGEVPFVSLSAKTGEGIDELTETILLVSDIQNFEAREEQNGEGVVIESHLDKRRGNTATLIIKNGTLKKGMFIVAGEAFSPVKIFENFLGKPIESATFSSPVLITGFNKLPPVGETFFSFNSKNEAENYLKTKIKREEEEKTIVNGKTSTGNEETKTVIEVPILLKADTLGSLEAVRDEILKLANDNVKIKIIGEKTGEISEDDIKFVSVAENSIVLGFNVLESKITKTIAERMSVSIKTFDIIYKLVEWLREEIENRAPVETVEESVGQVQILKLFKKDGARCIAGGRVISGKIIKGGYLKYLGQKQNIDTRIQAQTQFLGKIIELEKNKVKSDEVKEGNEFGVAVEIKKEIKENDILEIIERKSFKKKIY